MVSPASHSHIVMPPAATSDVLDLLVGQALDDIDAGRLDVGTALRMVAEIAWKYGYDQTGHFAR